jgi:hypothetical protein
MIVATISFVLLVLHIGWRNWFRKLGNTPPNGNSHYLHSDPGSDRGDSVRKPLPKIMSIEHIEDHGGSVIFRFKLARMLGCLIALTLHIWSLLQRHAENADMHVALAIVAVGLSIFTKDHNSYISQGLRGCSLPSFCYDISKHKHDGYMAS